MNYQELNKKTIREGFEKFIKENPHIYKAFEKRCFELIRSNVKKISAKDVISYLRWNKPLKSNDSNFKINDAYQSYFPRKFVEVNPDHKDVFRFRRQRNEESGPFMKVDDVGQLEFF